jgi:hypothetical protein
MITKIKSMLITVVNKFGYDIVRSSNPARNFHSSHYLRHNARRLEHLASLRIPVSGMSVLEIGAGIGDHSHYYMDRGCATTITDARPENLNCLRERYPYHNVQFLDMECPSPVDGPPFDVVHCYGLLYHLKNPETALEFLSRSTKKMLFLETCVSFGEAEALCPIEEDRKDPSQAWSGTGCRPTRPWVFNRLQGLFENVYVPKTQPNHEEFPLDWTAAEKHQNTYQRAMFIASHERLENRMLVPSLLNEQARHY